MNQPNILVVEDELAIADTIVYALDTTDRTVDTHIKTLRAKLRAIDPARDPIRTHRGMGYSLQP